MHFPRLLSGVLALCLGATASPTANLPISALTGEVDSDQSVVYYGTSGNTSLLIGNDGGAATGGIRSFSLTSQNATLTQTAEVRPGRTKTVGVLYNIDNRGKDVVVSIAAPDSLIRLFDINSLKQVAGVEKKALGDWSCLCTWGNYFFLFGKKVAMQFLVRDRGSLEVLEVGFFL